MLGFSSGAIKVSIAQNTDKKNYFEKLNKMIRSDKKEIELKYRELKIKVKGRK